MQYWRSFSTGLVLLLITVPCMTFAQAEYEYLAQYSAANPDLSLSTSPQYPGPHEQVRVTARSAVGGLDTDTLIWYVDGKEVDQGSGLTSITVSTGALGSSTDISVQTLLGGVATLSIKPVELDLLWESDSYTPPFFRGRALPSAGSTLNLQAVPRFKRSDGTFVPSSDIIFTWRKGSSIIASVSGRGKSSARIPGPTLFGHDTFSVEARSVDGGFAAQTSVQVTSIEPILDLYQNSPLFGVEYHDALGVSPVSESEAVLHATPYYLAGGDPHDSGLQYQWSVNGQTVPTNTLKPEELTVNADQSDGVARVGLSLTSATDFFLSVARTWTISLVGIVGDSKSNPFGITP